MSMFSRVARVLFSGLIAVQAAPSGSVLPRQSITALSSNQISAFTPYTWFANTGSPITPSRRSCGTNCDASAWFQLVTSGGDGNSVQYCHVGYDPALNTVIVDHQGTDPPTNYYRPQFKLEPLSTTLFPGIDSSIEVHDGFAKAQAAVATEVLAAVQTAMSNGNTNSVTLIEHSLGAAISLLDSVGNQAFANLSLTHISNKEGPVPIVPGRALGFVHPSGEVHFEDSGEWALGQDNPSTSCIVGDVFSILDATKNDHDGPYNGVMMGCN